MARRTLLAFVLLLALPARAQVLPARRALSVAAAANLKTAAEELKRGFEAAQPGVTVTLTFGASGAFFSQLQHGAPFDLFLSADREYPARLVAAGLGAGKASAPGSCWDSRLVESRAAATTVEQMTVVFMARSLAQRWGAAAAGPAGRGPGRSRSRARSGCTRGTRPGSR